MLDTVSEWALYQAGSTYAPKPYKRTSIWPDMMLEQLRIRRKRVYEVCSFLRHSTEPGVLPAQWGQRWSQWGSGIARVGVQASYATIVGASLGAYCVRWICHTIGDLKETFWFQRLGEISE